MKYNTIIQGNIKDVTLPEVDMVLTSPPYWGLRDYGVDGQLGLEPTPKLYIEHLCDIFDSLPIKKTGSLWVNLGDTYSATRWTGDNKGQTINKFKDGYRNINPEKITGLQDKTLVGIPQRFMIEMIDRGWVCRNVIIWHKPSCMPSSAKDRFTVDFEYLYFFTKQGKYYFEQQLEASECADPKSISYRERGKSDSRKKRPEGIMPAFNSGGFWKPENTLGRNKRCVWSINTQPSSIEHFAMYPEELCVTPIKAGCPEFICKKCGVAREKITEKGEFVSTGGSRIKDTPGLSEKQKQGTGYHKTIDKGLADCGCNAGWESGIVLDPFMGAGTTAVVAHKLGRNWIGVELNPKSIKEAEARIEEEMKQGNLFHVKQKA